MVILIDTREKLPLKFPKSWRAVDGTERKYLKVGDYAVRFSDGVIPPIRIERKNLGDLYGTLGRRYEQFRNEINRSIKANYRFYLFIEVPLSEVRKGCWYKKDGELIKVDRDGDELVQQLNTLEIKHGVIHKCFSNRSEMAYAIYKLFYAAGKQHVAKKKKERKNGKDSNLN